MNKYKKLLTNVLSSLSFLGLENYVVNHVCGYFEADGVKFFNGFFFNLSLCVPLVCSIMPMSSSLYRSMFPKPTMLVILSSKKRPTRSQISAPWKEPMAISKLESFNNVYFVIIICVVTS